jgi:hypothetical protein
MGRQPLNRMDMDTRWAYHRKTRELQVAHPTHWPAYWCAYQALLGESWATGERIRLRDAWVPSLPVSIEDAADALVAVGLLDKNLRVPAASWKEWFEPALERIERKSQAGKKGARARWDREKSNHGAESADVHTFDGQPASLDGPHANENEKAIANGMRPHASPMHHANHAKPYESLSPPSARDVMRHGLPHIDASTQAAIEAATGRPITSVNGWPAAELDRMVEEHGGVMVGQVVGRIMATSPRRPSWEQLVGATKAELEPPLPRPPRAAAAPKGMVQPIDEILEAVRAQQ